MRSERLLIYLKPKFLGDAVMATPLIHRLKREYDNPTVLAAPHIAEILRQDAGGLSLATPGEKSFRGLVAEARRLRQMRFGSVVLVNRSIRSAISVLLARIPNRIGHDTEGRGALLTLKVPYSKDRFEGESYGDLARAMGFEGDYSRVSLSVTPEERQRGGEMIAGAHIGIQPGATFAAKQLPADKLAQVINRLRESGLSVALIGGPDEKEASVELQSLISAPVVDLVGKCSLRESMGVCSALQAAAGGSTGLMHISVAVGCPTVTVIGPTLFHKWIHDYPPHQNLQVPTGNLSDLDPELVASAIMQATRAAQR